MNALEVQLSALKKLFKAAKADYVILGGIAVSVYGEPRYTYDIDANADLIVEDLDRFLAEAKKLGFSPLAKDIKRFVKKTKVIPLGFSKGGIKGKCDIIIAENVIERAALERGRDTKIANVTVKVISPEDLIIHKVLSDRPRDIEDARNVLSAQKGKLDKRYILRWLKLIDKSFRFPPEIEDVW